MDDAMSFTDDNLASWKEVVRRGSPWEPLPLDQIDAFLTRLEAAEVCAEIYAQDWPNGKAATTWRKACEK